MYQVPRFVGVWGTNLLSYALQTLPPQDDDTVLAVFAGRARELHHTMEMRELLMD